MRAVGRARDNELYVILADLTELGPDLAPVVNADGSASTIGRAAFPPPWCSPDW